MTFYFNFNPTPPSISQTALLQKAILWRTQFYTNWPMNFIQFGILLTTLTIFVTSFPIPKSINQFKKQFAIQWKGWKICKLSNFELWPQCNIYVKAVSSKIFNLSILKNYLMDFFDSIRKKITWTICKLKEKTYLFD